MKSKLAKNIIKYRKQKGLSQEKLAELAGLNRGNIAYYETEDSEKTYLENLHRIAKVLGIKIEDLLVDELENKNIKTNEVQIDSRTMEKINLILSLSKEKRHIVYTIVEALTKP